MRGPRTAVIASALGLFFSSGAGCGAPRIVLVRGEHGAKDAFEVRGLDPADCAAVALPGADLSKVFEVFVDGSTASRSQDLPPVLGSTVFAGGALRFEPRFPLEPGLRYRARLLPGPWLGGGGEGGAAIEEVFALPPRELKVTTSVSRVYPSASRLPQNQLKFYIHFSGPMRRRQVYERVHLLDSDGREVGSPFLEIGEELWDPAGTRFTLFFDPGRLKRGLRPHDEEGSPLEAGRRYTLAIDSGWLDAAGAPLSSRFRKDFEVGPPDYDPPDPKTWKLVPPGAGARHPLRIAFPEPLDHALLLRLVRVRGPAGDFLAGAASVDDAEREWSFTPEAPWTAGAYELVVGTMLEDLAGNSVGRPFEVDAFRRIESRGGPETVAVPFDVKAGPAAR